MLSLPDIISQDAQTKANITSWLDGNYDSDTKREIERLLEENPEEAANAFYSHLKFGTGGLRGIIGVGTNRMNRYTVRNATQGLANYLKKEVNKSELQVFISYDSRHHSRDFAEEAARVLAGNGIKVLIFDEMRPVPIVSFACRRTKSDAAIMITASHNPPEYNGYKVYWADGGQVLPPHDKGIIQEVEKVTDLKDVRIAELKSPLIQFVKEEIDAEYLETVDQLQHYREENQLHGGELNIVYTNLHGSGITVVPKVLGMWGFTTVRYVEAQLQADGDFPTVKSPNPEERSALQMGIEMLKEVNGDILIATDPDADRVGVAVKHHHGIELIDGNTIACLCLEHVCQALTKQKKMPERAAFIKTIVTTELFKIICEAYQKPCFDVLTGFKYIAQVIENWEHETDGYEFIFGGEESYGYLLGTHARDKDAVISCALIAEMALQAKMAGKTLIDLVYDLYEKYGVYRNRLMSVDFPETKEGHEQMNAALEMLRKTPPKKILGTEVVLIEDYLSSVRKKIGSEITEKLTLPKSNVLRFFFKDGTILTVRPSGTEPKVKLYCGVMLKEPKNIQDAIEHCDVIASDFLMAAKSKLLS